MVCFHHTNCLTFTNRLTRKACVCETFMSSELEGNYLKDNHKVTWMDKKKQTIIQKIQNFNEKLR